MNRRSFLSMIGLAPLAGAALASTSIAAPVAPQVISLAFDSSSVTEALDELEDATGRAQWTRWTHIGNVQKFNVTPPVPDSAFAISVIEHPPRELGGESSASLGIDVQSFLGAPRNELVRIDYGAHGNHSGSFALALGALGSVVPGLIGVRQDIRINHDPARALIILSIEPGYSEGLDGAGHNSLSAGGLDNSNVGPAPGSPQGDFPGVVGKDGGS